MVRASRFLAIFAALSIILVAGCGEEPNPRADSGGGARAATSTEEVPVNEANDPGHGTGGEADGAAGGRTASGREIATLGAGCFWCIEAVLEQIPGVEEVVSGYMGGEEKNPTYEQICTGRTGHAEVVQVTFDPTKITYAQVLEQFWKLHDPTTLNRQGNDVGPQYRSAIFYHSDEQRMTAEESKKKADASGAFARPIVTEITPASAFWVAENYHQDYYRLNKRAPYCQSVISPKLEKLGLEK